MTLASDLQSGGIRSGSPNQLRPVATSNLTFDGSGALNSSCGRDTDWRNGHFDGRLILDAGRLGDLTINMDGIAARATRTQCETVPPVPCPPPGNQISGFDFTDNVSLSIFEQPGADTATVTGMLFKSLGTGDAAVGLDRATSRPVLPPRTPIPRHAAGHC